MCKLQKELRPWTTIKRKKFSTTRQVFNRDISIQVIKLFSEIREHEKQEKYNAKYKRYEALKEQVLKEGGKPVSEQRAIYSRSVDGLLAEDAPELQEMEQIEVYTSTRDGPGSKTAAPPMRPPQGISILDALAATGLRSVRYLKEIPQVRKLVINDIVPEATVQALKNCEKSCGYEQGHSKHWRCYRVHVRAPRSAHAIRCRGLGPVWHGRPFSRQRCPGSS